MSVIGEGRRKRARVKKKRKRYSSDLACEGRLAIFLGPVMRKQVSIISEQQHRSMSEIGRLAFSMLINHYMENKCQLPECIEQFKRKGPGRPRKFQSFKESQEEEEKG